MLCSVSLNQLLIDMYQTPLGVPLTVLGTAGDTGTNVLYHAICATC